MNRQKERKKDPGQESYASRENSSCNLSLFVSTLSACDLADQHGGSLRASILNRDATARQDGLLI
ncbi:MAG TPA: hypothetical protein VF772_17660, partial [Terriglobales bacterium]